MSSKRISDASASGSREGDSELLFFLSAIERGHLRVNPYGRYVVYGEARRPDRRTREKSRSRGEYGERYAREHLTFFLTDKGQRRLEALRAESDANETGPEGSPSTKEGS